MLIDRKEARKRAKAWVKEIGEETWEELSRKERKALVDQEEDLDWANFTRLVSAPPLTGSVH
jgi:hypothetical protein